MRSNTSLACVLAGCIYLTAHAAAQSAPQPQSTVATAAARPVELPKDYVIGVEDVLHVVFWNAKEMSVEALVRPDGKISIPILNDVPAAGMTPEQLAASVTAASTKFIRDPGTTVIVKAVNSRKIHIVGEVSRPGVFDLGNEMNVLQALGEAGGFLETADRDDVVIARIENGQERRYKFNYNDVVRGRKLEQNIKLLPGDTIIVH